MTGNLNFDQIADYVRDGGNTASPAGHPAAPLWVMLTHVRMSTPVEDVHRAAAAVAQGLPDEVLAQALTPIAPTLLAGDEAQYAAFRQALLDEVHARALDEAAERTEVVDVLNERQAVDGRRVQGGAITYRTRTNRVRRTRPTRRRDEGGLA